MSDKIIHASPDEAFWRSSNIIEAEEVKQFIKDLKEEIPYICFVKSEEDGRNKVIIHPHRKIDKLAGPKLTK